MQLRRVLALFLLLFLSVGPVFAQSGKEEKICGIRGQNLMDSGDLKAAVRELQACTSQFPKSDWIISLYGEALYLDGNLEEGETQFRKALALNSNNPIAKKYIQEIRKTQDLMKDQDTEELIDRGKDIIQELLILAIGVWAGTMLTALSNRFIARFTRSNFRSFLVADEYESATDILEDLMQQHKKAELRIHLNTLLDLKPYEEAREIVIDYVEDKVLEDRIVYFLEKIHKKRMREKA